MRNIGSLPGEAEARLFSDYLLSRGIHGEIEAETDRTWSIWIRDEDHIAEAESALTRFRANPAAPEFHKATEEAAKARKAEAEDLARYRRRVRSGRSLFPKFGNYGVGILTFLLMLVCLYVAIYSKLGKDEAWLRAWHISDPDSSNATFLGQVLHGEFWRLFTPIFIHYGPLHLIFNMLWFYQLGSMIEARQSALFLFFFIAVSAAFSNVAQYFVSGPGFGGMSGVIYALAGYVWIRGKYNPASGLYLDGQSFVILLVWLVICFTGIMGPVGNMAHLAGLITGMAWGGIVAYFALSKPE
jgi:GlpG protein